MVVVFLLLEAARSKRLWMAAGHYTGAKGKKKKNLCVAADQDNNEENLYLSSGSGVLSTETRNIFSEPDAQRVLV